MLNFTFKNQTLLVKVANKRIISCTLLLDCSVSILSNGSKSVKPDEDEVGL